MARNISTRFRNAIYAEQTGDTALLLLTLEHPDLASPIRVVHNGADIVSRGNTYQACAFQFTLPDEKEGQPPQARLSICNVDRRIVDAMRTITTPPSVTAEIILAETPDTVEAAYEGLTLKDASYDALVVEGSLGYEDFLAEPFPGDTFNPATFPGVFGSTDERDD